MKKKYLMYAMQGEKMCFLHVLMNALSIDEAGHEVKIVLEGEAVTLPSTLQDNPLYQEAVDKNLVAGVCLACSKMLNVLEYNQTLPYPLLKDMNGHAGMLPFIDGAYEVMVF